MSSIAANHQRTEYAIDLKQRELVSPTTVPFLVPASQVHFCILVHDLPSGVDHVGKVEKAILAGLNGSGDDPNPMSLRRVAGPLQSCTDLARVQLHNLRKVIAGQICLWKQNHTAALHSRSLDVMQLAVQIEVQRLCPMHLHTRN